MWPLLERSTITNGASEPCVLCESQNVQAESARNGDSTTAYGELIGIYLNIYVASVYHKYLCVLIMITVTFYGIDLWVIIAHND